MIDSQEENLMLGVDPQVAFDKLAQFESPTDLVDFFQSEGIEGVRVDAHNCPISTWMRKQTNQPIGTCNSSIEIYKEEPQAGSWRLEDIIQTFETTPAISRFVLNFDNGQYPEITKVRDSL